MYADDTWFQFLIAACVCLVVLSIFVRSRLLGVFRQIGWLEPASELPPERPRVSVIIPARNEEKDLQKSLRTVLAQEGVELDVIIVNDHSTDRTGEIADAVARSDFRVRVLHDPVLPQGWLGKVNAMQQAACLARHDLLLFTDADIMHHPRCFAAGIAELKRTTLDFISLLPEFRPITFWENTLVPGVVGAFVQFVTPKVEDPSSPDALAAGAFLLVKREVFDAVGGFETVKGAVADDVGFARTVKLRGYRTGLRFAPSLLSVSLFKTEREAFWSSTKNVLIAIEGVRWLAGPLAPLTAVLFLAPFFVFWLPVVTAMAGFVTANPVLLAAGAATYVSQLLMLLPVQRVYRYDFVKLLCFPLVAVPLICCGWRALYYRWVHKAVLWRGRVIPVTDHNSRTE
jgi:glycosyltransferase involved in cell wall biosynthesis